MKIANSKFEKTLASWLNSYNTGFVETSIFRKIKEFNLMAYGIITRKMRSNTQTRPRSTNIYQAPSNTGLEGKIKVSAKQYHDKYIILAQEAMSMSDRVVAEGYYQQAEHYLRIMTE